MSDRAVVTSLQVATGMVVGAFIATLLMGEGLAYFVAFAVPAGLTAFTLSMLWHWVSSRRRDGE